MRALSVPVTTAGPKGYELRVEPLAREGYAVSLWQAVLGVTDRNQDARSLVRVAGQPLRAVMDQVLSGLRKAGYKATDLGRERRKPFVLAEVEAVRLGVLFLAVKSLRKVGRMRTIAERVGQMELEELYYWFSKMTSRDGRRASRALRVLMAKE